jgi:hypothetical protein
MRKKKKKCAKTKPTWKLSVTGEKERGAEKREKGRENEGYHG